MYVYRCPRCPAHVALRALHTPQGPECVPCAYTMVLMPDTAKALLPLDPQGPLEQLQMVPLKVEHLREAGILLPETQDALEWLYRHRERNGMAEAFCKVGGRRCIDLVAFARLMREKRA